jgi:acetolactate synthase-1/2/3 large subunit
MTKKNNTSPNTPMNGGRFMAETLKGYGVTHIFFMEAFLREFNIQAEALGMERVLGHSEKGVAYMADGYARITRRPGVCLAQSVGAANMAAGLQDAFLALSPVLAITGRQVPLAQHRHAYQEILHIPLFEPVTKFNALVESPAQLPFLLRQALREALTGAPGPVHLDVMDHVGRVTENAEINAPVIIEERLAQSPPFRPEPESQAVEAAAQMLKAAQRPVIVAGGGALASSAQGEILELAEKLSIPVATSINAKGLIPENHPLCLGVVGMYSRWCANKIVAAADLVLFVGSRTGDMVTHVWRIPPQGTPVIQIDIDPAELGRNYPNAVSLLGDAKVTVRRIIEASGQPRSNPKWTTQAQKTVQAWYDEIAAHSQSAAVPIRVERLCAELTAALPPNAVLVADTGYAGIWTASMVLLTHPGQSYLRAAGSLGWGFPASLGAKCGAPDRPVICFTGDGGFWYHLNELETAVRRNIKTVTVVNNNHGFAQCSHGGYGVDFAYAGRPGNRQEIYKFRETDFSRLAKELGAWSIRVEKPDQIGPALKKALKADRPAVVEVITDEGCEAPVPWAPA